MIRTTRRTFAGVSVGAALFGGCVGPFEDDETVRVDETIGEERLGKLYEIDVDEGDRMRATIESLDGDSTYVEVTTPEGTEIFGDDITGTEVVEAEAAAEGQFGVGVRPEERASVRVTVE